MRWRRETEELDRITGSNQIKWHRVYPVILQNPSLLLLLHHYKRPEFCQCLRADALHLIQIIDALEWRGGSCCDDIARCRWPNARQTLKFLRSGGIHIDRCIARLNLLRAIAGGTCRRSGRGWRWQYWIR